MLQEFKQKLQALPYPLDEIAESAAKLFRKCDRENSAGSESVAILVREEALSRRNGVALAQITYALCLHAEYSTSEERIQWLEEAFAELKLGDPHVLSAARAMLSSVAAEEYLLRESSDRAGTIYIVLLSIGRKRWSFWKAGE